MRIIYVFGIVILASKQAELGGESDASTASVVLSDKLWNQCDGVKVDSSAINKILFDDCKTDKGYKKLEDVALNENYKGFDSQEKFEKNIRKFEGINSKKHMSTLTEKLVKKKCHKLFPSSDKMKNALKQKPDCKGFVPGFSCYAAVYAKVNACDIN